MARRVIGLDVGTYSVKVVHLEQRARSAGFDIHAYSELPLSRFVEEGKEKSDSDLQTEALLHLKKLGSLDGTWTVSGLPSAQGQIRSLDVPFRDTKKVEAVLPGLMDSHLPFSVENLLYTWFPVAEKGEGAHILVGFARKDAIADQIKHFQAGEVDPRVVTLKAAALYDLLSEIVPRESAAESLFAIVDIGHKSTGICIGNKSRLHFARSVPKGGFHVTQRLAESTGVAHDVAEKQKLSARELSEPIREGYYAIAREVRQTILAMESEAHQKVEQVFLVGGGSKAAGLSEFLASLLGTRVTVVTQYPDFSSSMTLGAESGLALSYALVGDNIAKRVPRFNFRKDEFAYSGELSFVRQRAPALITFGAILLALLGVTLFVNIYLLGLELDDLAKRQEKICPVTATEAEKKLSSKWCLERIKMEIDHPLGIPEHGATDIFLDLNRTIPATVEVKFKELMILAPTEVKFSAETSRPETPDELVKILQTSKCFDKVTKKKTGFTANQVVTFDLEMKYDCNKAKGK